MRGVRVIAIALTAALVAVSCSGDDGSDAEDVSVSDADDFSSAFSARCLEMDEDIEGLPEPVGLRSLGDLSRQAADVTTDGVARLREVDAPGAVAADVDILLDGFEGQAEILTRLADAAGSGDRSAVDEISTEGETARRLLAEQADALGVDCGLAGQEGVADQDALPDLDGSSMDPTEAPSPTVIPEFGDDPALDALARDCGGGDPEACDILSLSGAPGSGYEEYGGTCGGRNESLAADVDTFCIDLYPEAVPPSADPDS